MFKMITKWESESDKAKIIHMYIPRITGIIMQYIEVYVLKGIKCVNDEIFHHPNCAGQHNNDYRHLVKSIVTYKSKLY